MTTPSSLDADAFGQRFAPSAPRNRAVRKLHALLEEIRPDAPLRDRLAQVERIGRWVVAGGKVVEMPDTPTGGEPPASARLRVLVHVVESVAEWREPVARLLRGVLSETQGVRLFARMGIPSDRGFFAESVDRLSKRFLPVPRDDHDLGELIERFLVSRRTEDWLEVLDASLPRRFFDALATVRGCEDLFATVLSSLRDATALLATRVSSFGLSEGIQARSPAVELRESPFFRLPRVTDALLASPAEAYPTLVSTMTECRRVLRVVTDNLETRGVSVDVVYRIELITQSLARIDLLASVLASAPGEERAVASADVVAALVEERLRERSVIDLGRTNLQLLTRKIIERAGHTGEHYITSTRGEWVKMLFSAAGGGLLTTFTAALKAVIAKLPLAPLQLGLVAGSNYALSFVAMQLLGFTLATKQPSMTAAALAGALRDVGDDPPVRTSLHPSAHDERAVEADRDPKKTEHAGAHAGEGGRGREASRAFRTHDGSRRGDTRVNAHLEDLVTVIARMVRSQIAAAAGNIGAVVPGAILFHNVWWRVMGRSFFDADKAAHTLHDHHPYLSGTIPYAMMTGCILWTASVCAGWLENWAVYRQIPEAIEDHRVGRFVGRRVMRWLSQLFLKHVSGFGGNVSLGFMLGLLPVIGTFVGLPIDVRHITLSTGTLTFAACTMSPAQWLSGEFLFAVLGLVCILACNFGVSFSLALAVAMRARGAKTRDDFRLAGALLRRLVKSPREFILPPPQKAAAASVAPAAGARVSGSHR